MRWQCYCTPKKKGILAYFGALYLIKMTPQAMLYKIRIYRIYGEPVVHFANSIRPLK